MSSLSPLGALALLFVAAVGLVATVIMPALIVSGRISDMERRSEQADEQHPR